MNKILGFIRTTLIGGVLFLLPLVAAAFLLRKAIDAARSVLRPIVQLLPADHVAGVSLIDMLAVLILVLMCFVAGLIASTTVGASFRATVESAIMRFVPGATMFNAMAQSGQPGTEAGVQVALARLDEAWVLAFVMERHPSGLFTVLVPSAPSPTSGSIYYLTRDQIRLLDVPIRKAMLCVKQLGVGSNELLPKSGPGAA